ncbi:MAG: hypothetical protein WD749_14645 [Phycisphaerales bacterium]
MPVKHWFRFSIRRRFMGMPAGPLAFLALILNISIGSLAPQPGNWSRTGRSYTVVLGLANQQWRIAEFRIYDERQFDRVIFIDIHERHSLWPEYEWLASKLHLGPLWETHVADFAATSRQTYPRPEAPLTAREMTSFRPIVADSFTDRHGDASVGRRVRAGSERTFYWPNLWPNVARCARLLTVLILLAALLRCLITTRDERAALRLGWRICPKCSYSLAGLGTDVCPECGAPTAGGRYADSDSTFNRIN